MFGVCRVYGCGSVCVCVGVWVVRKWIGVYIVGNEAAYGRWKL